MVFALNSIFTNLFVKKTAQLLLTATSGTSSTNLSAVQREVETDTVKSKKGFMYTSFFKKQFLILSLFVLFPTMSFPTPFYSVGDQLVTSEEPIVLEGMPELNIKELRFLLGADDWREYRRQILKGSFVKIVGSYHDGAKVGYQGALNFYSDYKVLTKPALVFKDFLFHKDDKPLCEMGPLISRIPVKKSRFYACGSYSCSLETSPKVFIPMNYNGLKDGLIDIASLKSKIPKKCKYDLSFFNDDSSTGNQAINFQVHEVLPNKEFAKIQLDREVLYLDLRFCKKRAEFCQFFQVENSPLEIAWSNLVRAKKVKDYELLNYLIENLRPCVERGDKKCILSYFVTQDDADNNLNNSSFVPTKVITDEIIADLKFCLSYEQLLPYGARTRARNDKICMFSQGLRKVYGISLPDAFKDNSTIENVSY